MDELRRQVMSFASEIIQSKESKFRAAEEKAKKDAEEYDADTVRTQKDLDKFVEQLGPDIESLEEIGYDILCKKGRGRHEYTTWIIKGRNSAITVATQWGIIGDIGGKRYDDGHYEYESYRLVAQIKIDATGKRSETFTNYQDAKARLKKLLVDNE